MFAKDKYYIVTQLATGGELFDRICEKGKFTEKDASQTVKQVLDAIGYLHQNSIVHRGEDQAIIRSDCIWLIARASTDLKPENLLYLTPEAEATLVLADFGIAKMLDSKEAVLTTMAGSLGYAAPEIMEKKGHGKPVDIWSLGVITYTLCCGYSPFRSERTEDMIEEIRSRGIIFHDKYWRDVSKDAKEFIRLLLQTNPADRPTCEVHDLCRIQLAQR